MSKLREELKEIVLEIEPHENKTKKLLELVK